MPGLVGEGEDVIEHVRLVVHEDVGLGIVGAGGECAALLAGVGVTVAPAGGGQAAVKLAHVFLAERVE